MIIHGDARSVLPTLDLKGKVVITDPPWPAGVGIGIVGAGSPAADLWRDVAALLGSARAVVVVQSSLDQPFSPPPLPFMQTCWLRSVPPSYRGVKILSHVAYVYGAPPRPAGCRVFSSESTGHTAESRAARGSSKHPCPLNLDHARWLLRWFGDGCHIVDPFCGSGVLLRCAAERGLPYTGIEVDERWLPLAHEQAAIGAAQQRLPLETTP